jgi:hypothetical protein
VKVLALRDSLRGDPRGCWADSELLTEVKGACQGKPTDGLGLCAFHRAKLFGKAS